MDPADNIEISEADIAEFNLFAEEILSPSDIDSTSMELTDTDADDEYTSTSPVSSDIYADEILLESILSGSPMSDISGVSSLSTDDTCIDDDLYIDITSDIISDRNRCTICYIYPKDMMCLPCRHLICDACSDECSKCLRIRCPFCKTPIQMILQVLVAKDECYLCNLNQCDHVIMPCMHKCICEQCDDRGVFHCPICMTEARDVVKVYN